MERRKLVKSLLQIKEHWPFWWLAKRVFPLPTRTGLPADTQEDKGKALGCCCSWKCASWPFFSRYWMQEMLTLCCQMWLQAQTSLVHSCSWATHSPLRHSFGHPWPHSALAGSATYSPHKSHFNPLMLGLNPQYWAWQWPMVFLKPACSCHLATLKLLSILSFWFLLFCHSRWTDQLASWRVKLEVSIICDSPPCWLTLIPLRDRAALWAHHTARVQPTFSCSHQHSTPSSFMLWSLILITSRITKPCDRSVQRCCQSWTWPEPSSEGPGSVDLFPVELHPWPCWCCMHTQTHTPGTGLKLAAGLISSVAL